MHKYTSSYIRGDFYGWRGDAVYELEDKSRWQLVAYSYDTQYVHRPKARVWHERGRYYLEVEGMDERKEVRRV